MAVTIGNEIHFLRNDTEIRYFTANTAEIYAIAYDSANRTLYVNGKNESSANYNIYYGDLVEEDLNLQPMLNGQYVDEPWRLKR